MYSLMDSCSWLLLVKGWKVTVDHENIHVSEMVYFVKFWGCIGVFLHIGEYFLVGIGNWVHSYRYIFLSICLSIHLYTRSNHSCCHHMLHVTVRLALLLYHTGIIHMWTFCVTLFSFIYFSYFGVITNSYMKNCIFTIEINILCIFLYISTGFCCAYLIFIANNLASIIQGSHMFHWISVMLPPLAVLCMLRHLHKLAIFR